MPKRNGPVGRRVSKSKRRAIKRSEAREAQLDKLKLADFSNLKLKLNPKAEEFDSDNALFMAVASACAYHTGIGDNDSDGFWAEEVFSDTKPKFDQYFVFPENDRDTEGFAMSSKDAVVISFCGTDSIKDWFTNLDVDLVEKYGSWVHEGFWDALNIVWVGNAKLLARLREVAQKKPVWFCGHSLGGALAILAAYRCINSGIPVQGVYTFGQPLVGEVAFKRNFDKLDSKVFRFVNEMDPVPLIPIRGIRPLPKNEWTRYKVGKTTKVRKVAKDSFVDVGKFHWFDANGTLHMDRTLPKRSSSSIGALIRGIGKLASGRLALGKHAMYRYIRHLLQNR